MENPATKLECLACGHTDYRMSNKPVGDLVENECTQCESDMVVREKDSLPESLEEVGSIVETHFYIWDFILTEENMEFLIESENREESFQKALDKLKRKGYIARMDEKNGELMMKVRKQEKTEKSNNLINLVLFIATIGTTVGVAGYWGLYKPDLSKAILFSFAIMTILGSHELGHKIAAIKNDVDASWPYFLPVPHPYIGTFGAIIKNKAPIPSKDALVEIGASGPIVGYCLAIPFSIAGLMWSSTGGEAGIFAELPKPLIFYFLSHTILGGFPPAFPPHPFAWAGFLGIFVTALNLLPTGQLDGGHIARSLLSQEKHFALTRSLGFALVLMGFLWPGFIILGLLVLFLVGKPHPGALNDVSQLKGRHRIMAATAIIILIISFPIPI